MEDQKIAGAGPSGSAPTASRQRNPARILLVDDDTSVRQLSSKVLTQSGYHVDAAEDGAAGWDALQARHYDLLITDNSMPKVSGVELVKMLRSAGMTLPVVMASGSIPLEALNGNASLRLAATLLKPFTMPDLLGAVEKILRAAEVTPGNTVPSNGLAQLENTT